MAGRTGNAPLFRAAPGVYKVIHPSKIGTFCSRKGDKHLGRGGPAEPSKFRKPSTWEPRGGHSFVSFADRLRSRAARDKRRKAHVAWQKSVLPR